MKRRSLLMGTLGRRRGRGLSPAPGPRRRPPRQALRFCPGRRGMGPDELLRPEGQHARRAGHQPLGERDEIRQAGNIAYAPFARNAAFFEKYHRRMLVINGVDAQTNSHTVGVVHNWSGRNSEGYPTTTAPSRIALRPRSADPVPELRRVLQHRRSRPIHPHRQCGPAARDRAPALTTEDPDWEIGDPHWEIYFPEADWRRSSPFVTPPPNASRRRRTCCLAMCATWGYYRSAYATEGLKAYADVIPPEHELEEWEEGPEGFGSSAAAPGAVDGAGLQDGGRGQCGLLAGGIRHPRQP